MNRSHLFEMYDQKTPLLRTASAAAPAPQDASSAEEAPASATPAAAAPAVLTPPAIGTYWTGQGGEYAGLSITDDGLRPCYLIVGADDYADLNHADALARAEAFEADGHKDFSLGNCHDGITLRNNVSDKFKKDWYWLKPNHPSSSGCAWCQDFNDGYQHWIHEDNQLRARPVRRSFPPIRAPPC